MLRLAAAQNRQHDIEIPETPAQRRVVGHRQIGEAAIVHAPRETLQRTQRQAKHDRVGIDALSAALDGLCIGTSLPQVPLHTDRHVTSGDQPSVVGRPVFFLYVPVGSCHCCSSLCIVSDCRRMYTITPIRSVTGLGGERPFIPRYYMFDEDSNFQFNIII
jgi:hypothetical protein